MGLGLVLFVWFVLCMGAALVIASGFALLTWWLVRRAKSGPRFRAILTAAILPPASVVLGLAGFLVYAFWCWEVRGVDPGMGDGWQVPLGSGYSLMMIDEPSQAFLEGPGEEQIAYGRLRLGWDDSVIYVETQQGRFLLIDKVTHAIRTFDSPTALDEALLARGSGPATLQTAEDAYQSLRWTSADWAILPLVFGMPALLTLLVALYVWSVRARAVAP